ncbi:MAG: hypothetical protein A2284_05825 [Deltaproteobacteria bacterium RIFOXYA12_FULL_61_11]|nr:MAG: hypothetical protein A2284_05825 [Deltaproteobacteria bacterium RIFOXYA12_FULL_61_11]
MRNLSLLTVVLVPLALLAAEEQPACEYKLLLRASLFAEPGSGIATVLAAMVSTAKLEGLDFKPTSQGKASKYRTLRYLDTATALLTGRGFVLRHRAEQGAQHGELTLKFSHADLAQVAAAPVEPIPGLGGSVKLELDRCLTTLTPPTFGGKYARSGEAEPLPPPPLFSAAVAVFPSLATLGGADSALSARSVDEEVVTLGKLKLPADSKVQTALALWRKPGTSAVLIGELSFRASGSEGAIEAGDRVLERLGTALANYVVLGCSKTAALP